MTILKFSNNAQTTIAAPLSIGTTTVTLAPGSGSRFPSLSAGYAFKATLTDAATGLLNEIVLATAISGDTLTIVRAQESTADQAWLTGDFFSMLDTAGTMNVMVQSAQLQSGTYVFAIAGGTVDNLTATINSTLTSLPDGMPLLIKASGPNLDSPSLALTLGSTVFPPYPIIALDGSDLSSGDIPYNGFIIELIWNASQDSYVMQNIPVNSVIYASSATTQAGLAAFQAVTPAGLAATMIGGLPQTETDVTASRAIGTTYTNSTGATIEVRVSLTYGSGSNTSLIIGGITQQCFGSSTPENILGVLSFLVKKGATYALSNVVGANVIDKWVELR